MSANLLLASDHLDPARVALGSIGAGVAFALTPGEGPSRNPKQQKNEDSLGVLLVPGGVAAVVADSHWGAYSGEALVRVVVAALARRAPATHAELSELLLDCDRDYRKERPAGDRSETTVLAAIVRSGRAIWASIADSHVYVVSARGGKRLNLDRPLFAGGEPPLRAIADRVGRDTVTDSDERELGPGELLLLASDGIAFEDSGLETPDLARELSRPGALAERVRRLIDRARRAPGGRDNVALVLIDPALVEPALVDPAAR
jgi:serine/threonine protein phosphatase PrpC